MLAEFPEVDVHAAGEAEVQLSDVRKKVRTGFYISLAGEE
jgi:hypothetical protein